MALTPNVQYFTLTLDTTAPSSLAITASAIYKQSDSNTFKFSAQGAAADNSYYKVFVNTSSTAQLSDFESLTWTTYAGETTITFDQQSATSKTKLTEGANYIHLIVMDDVGNVSNVCDSSMVIYDTHNPSCSDIFAFGNKAGSLPGYATSTDFGVTLTISDYNEGLDVAGIATAQVLTGVGVQTGKTYTLSDTEKAASKTANGVEITINDGMALTTGDGNKTVQVLITDAIGNSFTAQCVIELDTTAPTLETTLKKADGKTDMPAFADESSACLAVVIGSYDNDEYIYYECDSTGEPVGTKPTTWTACGSATFTTPVVTFASTEAGIKGVAVEVRDNAGNITKSYKTFTKDSAAPTVSLTLAANSKISDKQGFSSVNVSFSATDDNNFPTSNLVKIYVVKDGSDVFVKEFTVTNGGGTKTISDTLNLTYSDITAKKPLPDVGYAEDYYFKAEVDDITGQHATKSSATANALGIDIVGPTTTKGSVNTYYKATTGNIEFTGWTGTEVGISTVSEYFAWVSAKATETELPSSPVWTTYASGTVQVAASTFSEGTQYLHVIHKDALGNFDPADKIQNSDSFVYDKTAPTCAFIELPTDPIQARQLTVKFQYADTSSTSGVSVVSGVKAYKIWGDIVDKTAEPETWTDLTSSASPESVVITLLPNTGDVGTKTLNVKVIDNAGNISTVDTKTVTLETTDPVATLTVYAGTDTEHTTSKNGQKIATSTVNFKLQGTDKEAKVMQYKIYSCDSTGATPNTDLDFGSKATTWTDFATQDKSVTEFLDGIAIKAATDKTIYIKLEIKDDNGNVGYALINFIYDTTGPDIKISTVDWEKLSKVHQKRRNATAAEIDQYADETIFKWTANENMIQWKVCVNCVGQTAADATPIGTSGGSTNMTGTNYTADTEITSMIRGADFAADATVDNKDGAYEVIMYGQDEGGVWSKTHAVTMSPKLAGEAEGATNFKVAKSTNQTAIDSAATQLPGAVVNDLSADSVQGTATVTMDMTNYNVVGPGDTVDVYHYE